MMHSRSLYSLLDLPCEILSHVTFFLPYRALTVFARVSQACHALSIPYLYRTVEITTKCEDILRTRVVEGDPLLVHVRRVVVDRNNCIPGTARMWSPQDVSDILTRFPLMNTLEMHDAVLKGWEGLAILGHMLGNILKKLTISVNPQPGHCSFDFHFLYLHSLELEICHSRDNEANYVPAALYNIAPRIVHLTLRFETLHKTTMGDFLAQSYFPELHTFILHTNDGRLVPEEISLMAGFLTRHSPTLVSLALPICDGAGVHTSDTAALHLNLSTLRCSLKSALLLSTNPMHVRELHIDEVPCNSNSDAVQNLTADVRLLYLAIRIPAVRCDYTLIPDIFPVLETLYIDTTHNARSPSMSFLRGKQFPVYPEVVATRWEVEAGVAKQCSHLKTIYVVSYGWENCLDVMRDTRGDFIGFREYVRGSAEGAARNTPWLLNSF